MYFVTSRLPTISTGESTLCLLSTGKSESEEIRQNISLPCSLDGFSKILKHRSSGTKSDYRAVGKCDKSRKACATLALGGNGLFA